MTETHIDDTSLRTVRATPALCGAAAMVAAFFMPLVGVAGFFSTTGWSYLRLAMQSNDDGITAEAEILIGTLAATGMLAVGVVITEALHKRSRGLLLAAGVAPFGLAIYLLIKGHTLEFFQFVDIGAYVGLAAAIVMLGAAANVFDRGNRRSRLAVYAVSAATALAGVLIPIFAAPSFAEGFEKSFNRPATAILSSARR